MYELPLGAGRSAAHPGSVFRSPAAIGRENSRRLNVARCLRFATPVTRPDRFSPVRRTRDPNLLYRTFRREPVAKNSDAACALLIPPFVDSANQITHGTPPGIQR